MSVSGRNIKDCLRICNIIDEYKFPLIEINVSCPHSNEVNGFITRDAEFILKLIKTLKREIKTPIALKLGHSDHIVHIAKAAERAGVDAIVAINTIGPVIDFAIDKGKPELTLGIQNGRGGLSGRPIFCIALTDVVDLSQNLKIPIIACGGVTNPEDAIKMIMAGASAVQIYSAVHMIGKKRIVFLDKFIKDFNFWLRKHKYTNVNSLRGILLSELSRPHQMNRVVPRYNKRTCNGCGKCIDICLEEAMKMINNKIIIDKKKCVGCGACVSVCRTKALR